jgi:hypothetical protein
LGFARVGSVLLGGRIARVCFVSLAAWARRSAQFGHPLLGAPRLYLTPLAPPVAKAATAVEGVRRRFAVKHRPPVAPPASLARSNIEMCWVAASRAVGQVR